MCSSDLADVSVLSFNGNKTITSGGGGMVLGNDKELMNRIRHLTTTARVGTEYDFDMVGYNYRMTNIQAAVGCAQMERLKEFVKRKRKIRHFYASAFEGMVDIGVSLFPETPGGSCWLSGLVLPKGKTSDDVRRISGRLREKGIESRTFWKPVHLQKPFKNAPCILKGVAEDLWGRIVTLPCSTNITDAELEYVAGSMKEVLKNEL